MNKDILQGHWHEVKGQIKQKWADLTDDDIAGIRGSSEELQGLLQTRYGYEKEEAKKQIENFMKDHKCD